MPTCPETFAGLIVSEKYFELSSVQGCAESFFFHLYFKVTKLSIELLYESPATLLN